MLKKHSPIYVLGTGLSHNGSAVLLKDGKVCVGIEKERITRKKHDGGNDNDAIRYCLEAEGINLADVAVVVQCANFEIPAKDFYRGERIFKDQPTTLISISHHLAHAYSAVGTSPFNECVVMVIDGCGSPLDQFIELQPNQTSIIADDVIKMSAMQCEKDSFYHFKNGILQHVWKDFSTMATQDGLLSLPTTEHSIGGFYAAVSQYVFGDMNDVGKLMGLAPFGKDGVHTTEAFYFENDRLFVHEGWKSNFKNPSKGYNYFKAHFQEYADVAKWAQVQIEQAVIRTFSQRLKQFPSQFICYSGGVALNAVANSKLVARFPNHHFHFEPAAGDNGLALGCAYYGWLEYLQKEKVPHDGSTCFGREYTPHEIDDAIAKFPSLLCRKTNSEATLIEECAEHLAEGKTLAWFQSGSEFGPRALGRRSILAHPGIDGLKEHINRNIKFREDFRPFAPSIPKEEVSKYFENGLESPYMILVDRTKKEHLHHLKNVTHADGSARTQTVNSSWNSRYAKLLTAFGEKGGIPILLNTSLNRKGTPMVETPFDALQLFEETALDILVIDHYIITKPHE